MVPSEFPEVQPYNYLKRLLAQHVDMQFEDVRTMLRLPTPELAGGCNFAVASFLFNIVSGSSVCFYNTSEKALTARRERGARFKGLLGQFYPWDGEPLSKAEAVELIYRAARNPLTHSLGLDAPSQSGQRAREIKLAKRHLSEAQIAELETSIVRPGWLGPTVTKEIAPSGVEAFVLSVPALYWGVHRMLHALFADVGHVVDADGLAKAFGPLWDRYIPVGDAVTMTDEVKIELGRQSAPPAEQA